MDIEKVSQEFEMQVKQKISDYYKIKNENLIVQHHITFFLDANNLCFDLIDISDGRHYCVCGKIFEACFGEDQHIRELTELRASKLDLFEKI